MPGVLMIESLTQVATLLLLAGGGAPAGRAWLRAVENAKFRRQVVPGDRLELQVTLGRRRGRIARAAAVATVAGEVVAECDLVMAVESARQALDRAPIVHETAIVDPGARLGEGTVIGPFATIGPNVTIGRGCRVGASTVIDGTTEIGDETEIYPFASIGLAPQDLKFKGEPTRLVIGRHNVVPRVRDDSPRHGGRRRPHDHRRQQSVHGLRARGARLPRRQPHDLRQRRDARRARHRRGLRRDQRVFRRAPVLPRRAARVHRRVHGRHARRAAVREDGRQPGADLRLELDRAGAARASAPSSSRSCGGPIAICSSTTRAARSSSSSATRRCARRRSRIW